MKQRFRARSHRGRAVALVFALLAMPSLFAKGNPKISVADDPSTKEGTPSLVFIEVSDFECPYCGQGAFELIPRIHEEFVKTGEVELIFLDNPLEIHPDAFRAAQAAACAGEQGKFWDMHHELFGNQKELGPDQLPARAEAVGLDLPAFQKCLGGHKHDGAIREDIRTARNLGINGTPAYLIGRRIEGGEKVEVLEVLHSSQSWPEVEAKIKALLPAKPPPPPPPPPKSTSPHPAPSARAARR